MNSLKETNVGRLVNYTQFKQLLQDSSNSQNLINNLYLTPWNTDLDDAITTDSRTEAMQAFFKTTNNSQIAQKYLLILLYCDLYLGKINQINEANIESKYLDCKQQSIIITKLLDAMYEAKFGSIQNHHLDQIQQNKEFIINSLVNNQEQFNDFCTSINSLSAVYNTKFIDSNINSLTQTCKIKNKLENSIIGKLCCYSNNFSINNVAPQNLQFNEFNLNILRSFPSYCNLNINSKESPFNTIVHQILNEIYKAKFGSIQNHHPDKIQQNKESIINSLVNDLEGWQEFVYKVKACLQILKIFEKPEKYKERKVTENFKSFTEKVTRKAEIPIETP